jgi:hypothetical protein
MTATAKHGATDPRDKVYALLVICDFPDHDPVQPDYSKTKHQVFAQATMAMIRDFTGCPYLDIPFRSLRSKNRPRTPASSTLNPSIPNAQDPSVRLSWVFDFAIASQTQHSSQSHDYNHPTSFIPQRLRVGVGYNMSTAPSLHHVHHRRSPRHHNRDLPRLLGLQSGKRYLWYEFPAHNIFDVYNSVCKP